MNKTITIMVVVVLLVAGGSFYAGMKYDQGKRVGGAGNFQDRQGAAGQFGNRGQGGARNMRAGAGVVSGDVTTKDDKTMTIKLRAGGSRVVILTSTTEIMKSAKGSLDDVQVGTSVSVMGATNSDGSITAQSIQLRPAILAGERPASPQGGQQPGTSNQ